MGAWIEIQDSQEDSTEIVVAPLVGAWIEIVIRSKNKIHDLAVAPLVGAWIEMSTPL